MKKMNDNTPTTGKSGALRAIILFTLIGVLASIAMGCATNSALLPASQARVAALEQDNGKVWVALGAHSTRIDKAQETADGAHALATTAMALATANAKRITEVSQRLDKVVAGLDGISNRVQKQVVRLEVEEDQSRLKDRFGNDVRIFSVVGYADGQTAVPTSGALKEFLDKAKTDGYTKVLLVEARANGADNAKNQAFAQDRQITMCTYLNGYGGLTVDASTTKEAGVTNSYFQSRRVTIVLGK